MSTWFQIFIAASAVLISGILSYLSYRKGKADLFFQLFTRYNEKYSKLNDKLYLILEKEAKLKRNQIKIKDFDKQEINTIMDYLNLCSEEYLWRKKGFIDKNVWESWQDGIQWWYDNSIFIQLIWKQEFKQKRSYYIDDNKTFIKIK